MSNPARIPKVSSRANFSPPRTTVALVPSTAIRTNTLDIKQRMQAVLRAEAEAINAVDVSQDFVTAVSMAAREGKILTTGTGKAGHIGEKFCSHPVFYHDSSGFYSPCRGGSCVISGRFGPNDVMIAFSPAARARGHQYLKCLDTWRHHHDGVTSHPDSELRDHSDLALDMGVITEPCPTGFNAQCSMAVMLAISDALALAC